MAKIYLSVIYVVLNLVIVLGFIAPYLISAKSDVLAIAGVALIILDGLHLVLFVPKVVKNIREFVKLNKKENEKK